MTLNGVLIELSVIEFSGAKVAQYCGRCVHTKIVNHPAWGKADHFIVLLINLWYI